MTPHTLDGHALIRPDVLAELNHVISVARTQESAESMADFDRTVRVILRPLELLDEMWREVEGALSNHPDSIERLRLLLLGSAGWHLWLRELLGKESSFLTSLSRSVTSLAASNEVPTEKTLVDPGALVVLCVACLRVSVHSDPELAIGIPIAGAFLAGPAESLVRASYHLLPDNLPTLIRGLAFVGTATSSSVAGVFLTNPASVVRLHLLLQLRRLLTEFERADRKLGFDRWEAADASAITGIVFNAAGEAILEGLGAVAPDDQVVVHGPSHTVLAVETLSGPAGGSPVRVALDDDLLTGWIGVEALNLRMATNAYREVIRQRWSVVSAGSGATVATPLPTAGAPTVGLSMPVGFAVGLGEGVPVALVPDIHSPACPPRTALNRFIRGPVLVWSDLHPEVVEPDGVLVLHWRSEGADTVEIQHLDMVQMMPATGKLEMAARAFGSATVQITPVTGAQRGVPNTHTYRVTASAAFDVVEFVGGRPLLGQPGMIRVAVSPLRMMGSLRYSGLIEGTTELTPSEPLLIEVPNAQPGVVAFSLMGPEGTVHAQTNFDVDPQPRTTRRLVLVRPRVLSPGTDAPFYQATMSNKQILSIGAKAGVDLEIEELSILPDALAVLLSLPTGPDGPDVDRLLRGLLRSAVCSSGGEDAVWLALLPGQEAWVQSAPGQACSAAVVTDEKGVFAMFQSLTDELPQLGSVLRMTGQITSHRVDLDPVRQELRPYYGRSTEGSYLWKLKDSAGETLFEVPFAPKAGPFAVLLPNSAAVSEVQLVGERGETVVSLRRPLGEPQVQFDAWGGQGIELAYSHSDTRGARFYLELSRGKVWTPAVELNRCPGPKAVTLVELGDADRARVAAIDGWNVAVSGFDGDIPAALAYGRVRPLPDGRVTTEWPWAVRWRGGDAQSTERAYRPGGAYALELLDESGLTHATLLRNAP